MIISCECGNKFDFADESTDMLKGFEFIVDKDDKLILHCEKCDACVIMS